MYATISKRKFGRNIYLPELLVIGSEILLESGSSVVFATGTLNVNPICNHKKYPLGKYKLKCRTFFIPSKKIILNFI